jgi:ABC-type lipoprotein export system ATPase subunit
MLLQTTTLEFAHLGQRIITFPEINVDQGEALLVLGRSGSGKTTLLNLLAGLLRPAKGEIKLADVSLSSLSGQALDMFRGKNIGIVFQKPHLIAALNVRENLELAHFFGKTKGQAISDLLSELGIAHKSEASVQTLSEGEAQRVSIARALANCPRLILADEPTSSLDDENTQKVIQLLTSQAAKIGAALLIVTHDQRVKNHISNYIEVKANEPV